MKLVTIFLLFCVHSADPAPCNGKQDKVVFCQIGDALIIPTPNLAAEWHFKTQTGTLPSGLAKDDTAPAGLKGTLTAADTGVYFATYPNNVDKYTIIVGAVTCPEGNAVCNVTAGKSIKLDSTDTGVTWMFKGKDGAEAEVTDSADPPKFTAEKKELGLFDIGKAESGTYQATKSGTAAKTFKVEVRTAVTSAKVVKRNGCDLTLVCKVIGEAKEIKWTKDDTALAANPPKTQIQNNVLTISSLGATDNGKYVCKATEYGGANTKDSPAFTYTYATPAAISEVSIRQSGRVLTCDAQGDVQSYQWLRDGESVQPSDGAAGKDRSKFTLDPQAKGDFICKATSCDGTEVGSKPFLVDPDENPADNPAHPVDNRRPGAAIQGVSCSVALLVISVFVGLYVMML